MSKTLLRELSHIVQESYFAIDEKEADLRVRLIKIRTFANRAIKNAKKGEASR